MILSAVIGTESSWNPNATSPRGAGGLAQLTPDTAKTLGVTNVYDPVQAVNGGARYLSSLIKRYKGRLDLALAAYNAGPGAVDKYGTIPPYKETQDYVRKVFAALQGAT